MGASGKWIKALIGLKKSPKTSSSSSPPPSSSSDNKDKSRIRVKSKKWSIWKSSQAGNEDVLDAETIKPGHLLMVPITSLAAPETVPFAATATTAAVSLKPDASHLAYEPKGEAWAAAIAIQTVFRGFLARRALCALKGLVRLQALVRGHIVRKQTAAAFHSMQALIRVQTRACAYRAQISSERQSVRQKIKGNHRNGSHFQEFEQGWCDAIGTMEEMQAKIQQRQEAAIKRERAFAYAFRNQRRANCKTDLEDVDVDGDKWHWLRLDNKGLCQAADEGSINSTDISGKKKTASMTQTVKVKRSSRLSFDASKDNPKSLTRGGSHGNLLLAHTSDGHSDASYSPSRKLLQKTRHGASEFSVKAPERRAFSNPKQRPQSEEAQTKKASSSVQKLQHLSHNR